MAALFHTGAIIDLILLVMAVEGGLLWLLRRTRKAALDLAFAILPGALILLAFRGAVPHGDWRVMAGFLAAAFPVHLTDLWRRGFLVTRSVLQ